MYGFVRHTLRSTLGIGLLTLACTSYASLLDCTKTLPFDVATEQHCSLQMTPVMVASVNIHSLEQLIDTGKPAFSSPIVTGFEVNSNAAHGDINGSAPLIGLLGIVLTVLLVKAKSFNTK